MKSSMEQLSHWSHSDLNVSIGHAQDICIESAMGHHFVKVFSPTNGQVRDDMSFLGRSIRRIAQLYINVSCHARYASTCLYFFLSSGQIHFSFIVLLSNSHFLVVISPHETSDLSKSNNLLNISYIASTSWKSEWRLPHDSNNCHISMDQNR